MNSGIPSRTARATAWIAVALTVVLLALGTYQHGFSLDVQHRFWTDIFARFGGPMTFRFFLQPTMAGIAALHDGLKDAREGHKSFFWTAWSDPKQRTGRLNDGLIATARIMLLGISMDVVYQLNELNSFYPAEAAVMAILLAVIPYFILRWIVEHVARWWFMRDRPLTNERKKVMENITSKSASDQISVELSSRRTGMSFQRTRMSADRTLMSVIRTSLSLISFGFTIFQVFEKLRDQTIITHASAARNFGVTLVLLGILMLIGGIIYHVQFMVHLREQRKEMMAAGLVHGESKFPLSLTLATAVILLLIGIGAIVSMVFHVGPF